jgi:hypothetical protein
MKGFCGDVKEGNVLENIGRIILKCILEKQWELELD